MLRKIDLIGTSLILIIGIGHSLSTFYFFQPLVEPGTIGPAREPALWWFSGGVCLWFGAALNFLRIFYGKAHRPIVQVACAANVAMLLYEFWLVANNPSFLEPARVGLTVVQIVITILSFRMLLKR